MIDNLHEMLVSHIEEIYVYDEHFMMHYFIINNKWLHHNSGTVNRSMCGRLCIDTVLTLNWIMVKVNCDDVTLTVDWPFTLLRSPILFLDRGLFCFLNLGYEIDHLTSAAH